MQLTADADSRVLTLNGASKTLAGAATSLTFAGNFTHTGAHTLGLTTTSNTSVTLPTTGTLSTLAGSETLTNKTLTSPIISTLQVVELVTILHLLQSKFYQNMLKSNQSQS